MRNMKKDGILLLLLFSLSFLTGCSKSDWGLLVDLAIDWAAQHEYVNTDANGNLIRDDKGNVSVNKVKIGADALLGSGDDQTDAVLGAGMAVRGILEADNLEQNGFKDNDISKINKAIDMRPNDYSYRNSRGVLNLQKGDITAANKDFAEANKIAAAQSKNAQLKAVDDRIAALNEKSPSISNSKELMRAKMNAWRDRYDLTKDPIDNIKAADFEDELLYRK